MNNNKNTKTILVKDLTAGQTAYIAGYWLFVEQAYIDDYEVVVVAKDSADAAGATEYFFGIAASVEVR